MAQSNFVLYPGRATFFCQVCGKKGGCRITLDEKERNIWGPAACLYSPDSYTPKWILEEYVKYTDKEGDDDEI